MTLRPPSVASRREWLLAAHYGTRFDSGRGDGTPRSWGLPRQVVSRDVTQCHDQPMSPWVLSMAVAVFVGLCAILVLSVRSARRDAAEGGVDAALRVVSGTLVPLTEKWRHGVVSASPGCLRFRPGGPAGARLPRGRPFDVPVTSVSADNKSHPALLQAWTIIRFLHVVQLLTPT